MRRTHELESGISGMALKVGYIERVDSQTVAVKIGGHAIEIFSTEHEAILWAKRRDFGVVESRVDYGDIRDTAFDKVAPALRKEKGIYQKQQSATRSMARCH